MEEYGNGEADDGWVLESEGSICSEKPAHRRMGGGKKVHHLKRSLINLSPQRKVLLETVWRAGG